MFSEISKGCFYLESFNELSIDFKEIKNKNQKLNWKLSMKIDYKRAEELLKKYIGDKKELLKHSKAVSEFIYEASLKLKKLNPEKDINPERMRIIGLLHDIGKAREGDHYQNGADILKEEDLEGIGEIVKKHGLAKELNEEEAEGDFEPQNIQEKLLTYADAHVKHGKVVSYEERLKGLLERSKSNRKKFKAAERGSERIKRIMK